MGIADDMNSLRQEITDAGYHRQELASERKLYVSETKQNVSDLMADYAAQHQKMAAELKADLKKSVSDLKNDSDTLVADYAAQRQKMAADLKADLKKSVSDLKNDSDTLVADYAKQRQEMTAEIRADLKKSVSDLKDTDIERKAKTALFRAENSEFIENLKNSTETLLEDYSDEHNAMRRAWRDEDQIIKPQSSQGSIVKVEQKVIAKTILHSAQEEPVGSTINNQDEPEVSVSDELSELKGKMFDIVTSSVNGISLTEIGDKLGVEWRKLIRPARELLDTDQVRKEDVNYFPKEDQKSKAEKVDTKIQSGYY